MNIHSPETLPALRSRTFTPLWISQSLSAMNDNIFRQGVIAILIVSAGKHGNVLASLTIALFMLPFFLFSATAGSIADRYSKARVMRWIRTVEIFVFAAAACSMMLKSTILMALCLFLGGTMATFYGPLKFAALPELLPEKQLVGANGLVEAGIFLCVLCGTMIGSFSSTAPYLIIAILLASTIAAWTLSWLIPARPAAAPDLKIDWHIVRTSKAVVRTALQSKILTRIILAVSWFWFVGSTFLTQFAGFVLNELHGTTAIGTLFLGLFSIGIAGGSLLCHKLLRGDISAKFVPLAALLMTVFMIDLFFAARAFHPVAALYSEPNLLPLSDFLSYASAWRIMFDLTMIALFAGLYVVPLTTMMQTYAALENRARIVAAGNILDAVFMVAASILSAVLLSLQFNASSIFLVIGIINGAVAIYICRLLPSEMIKGIFTAIFRLFYKIEIKGLENLKAAGPRAVLVVNHLSYLDGALLATFLPGKPLFAVSSVIANRWWAWPFLALVETYPMHPSQPMAAKGFIRAIQSGRHGIIFPEGRLTQTGALMKVYEGASLIANKADAPIVPVRIDGLQYTPFSKMSGKFKLRWFPYFDNYDIAAAEFYSNGTFKRPCTPSGFVVETV